MFVVNNLERLEAYGFEYLGGKNREGWATYKKELGQMRAYQSYAALRLVVNPYEGTQENELVVQCVCNLDKKAWDAYDAPVFWSFEEIGQLVRDGVVDWVESTPS